MQILQQKQRIIIAPLKTRSSCPTHCLACSINVFYFYFNNAFFDKHALNFFAGVGSVVPGYGGGYPQQLYPGQGTASEVFLFVCKNTL